MRLNGPSLLKTSSNCICWMGSKLSPGMRKPKTNIGLLDQGAWRGCIWLEAIAWVSAEGGRDVISPTPMSGSVSNGCARFS